MDKYAPLLKQMRAALAEWETETDDHVPKKRRADEFDRETGDRLKGGRRKTKRKAKKKKAAK